MLKPQTILTGEWLMECNEVAIERGPVHPGPATWDGHPMCLLPSGGDVAGFAPAAPATNCPGLARQHPRCPERLSLEDLAREEQ